jgi:hypothetical protein
MNVNDKIEIMSKKQIRSYYNMLTKHLAEWSDRELQKLEQPNTLQVGDSKGKLYENEVFSMNF